MFENSCEHFRNFLFVIKKYVLTSILDFETEEKLEMVCIQSFYSEKKKKTLHYFPHFFLISCWANDALLNN